MNINPNLNIDQLRKDYKRDKSIVIHDFLVPDDAEFLWDWLANKMPEDWWFTAMKAGGEGYDSPLTTRRTSENIENILNKYGEIYDSFYNNEFSYIFDRTMPHVDTCDCAICAYGAFFSGVGTPDAVRAWIRRRTQDSEAGMVSFVKKVTGLKGEFEKGELFASCFTENQFLSPHHDHEKGKIGTVFSLTKDWHPSYGGNLCMLEPDYKTIKKVITSTFNRLVLFDIPSRNGIPHYVSHVTPGVRQKRLSITGWLK